MIIIAVLFTAFCLATVNSQDNGIIYVGLGQQGYHLYSYQGQDYAIQTQLHELSKTNPEAFRQRFLNRVQTIVSSRFNEYDPDREAQTVNSFRPNKKNPSAVYFPTENENYNKPYNQEVSSRTPVQQNTNYRPQTNKKPLINQLSTNQQNADQPTFNPQAPSQNGFAQAPNNQPPFKKTQNGDEFDIPIDTGYNVEIPYREVQDRGNRGITEFAWRLFKASNSQSDYVMSPMSPQILLSYLTWVSEGRTRQELTPAVGYGSADKLQKLIHGLLRDGARRELQIATAFFISQDMRLNQQFFDQSKDHVDIVNVDFKNPEAASRTLSKWANMKTKNALKLSDLTLSPSTKIALASAVYFKANWIYKFNPAQPGWFNTPQGRIEVPMMNMKKKFRWGKIGEVAEWAAIPYESDDSLVIILPNRDQTLDGLIKVMSEQTLVDVLYDFDRDSTNADVNITLPKFKLQSTTNLVEPLKQMGIQSLFSPRAELPYLSDYQSVTVSNAQQQASIDVNEEGTVVVSFTNINVVALSFTPPVPSVNFVVDRPFLAVIANRDRNIPYAIAKITNPTY